MSNDFSKMLAQLNKMNRQMKQMEIMSEALNGKPERLQKQMESKIRNKIKYQMAKQILKGFK